MEKWVDYVVRAAIDIKAGTKDAHVESAPDEAWLMDSVKHENPDDLGKVFWSVYGVNSDGTRDCIADFPKEEFARETAQKLTRSMGVDSLVLETAMHIMGGVDLGLATEAVSDRHEGHMGLVQMIIRVARKIEDMPGRVAWSEGQDFYETCDAAADEINRYLKGERDDTDTIAAEAILVGMDEPLDLGDDVQEALTSGAIDFGQAVAFKAYYDECRKAADDLWGYEDLPRDNIRSLVYQFKASITAHQAMKDTGERLDLTSKADVLSYR